MIEMLLTVEQAAQRLQIHPTSVRRQLQRGHLRGVKRGNLWRVPESALLESSPASVAGADSRAAQQIADSIWRDMNGGDEARRDQAIIALGQAPEAARALVMQRSGEVAARFYATPAGEAELADWRALDGEVFHDDAGDYYSDEEEAQFRAGRETEVSARQHGVS